MLERMLNWINGYRRGGLLWLVAACLLGAATSGMAQTDQDARIKALEQALQEVKSQAAAGQDVNARIAALEQQLNELKADISAGQGPAVAGAPATEAANAVPEAGMQGAPNPLQDDKRFLTGQDLLDATFPNSLPIPGSNNRFAIGGYAKVDLIQDLDYVGDPYEFELATIPVEGTPNASLHGATTGHAKETRINLDFRRRAHNDRNGKDYPLQVFVEFDFFEDNPSLARQPRLRHAYGVLGRFLAGQTWSINGDLEALAGTIDFSGGDALYGARVAQVRWQDSLSDRVSYAVGLEEPKFRVGNPLGLGGVSRLDRPNVAGRIRWAAMGGSHIQVGADLFELNWQGGVAGPSDTEFGYGLNFTGRYLLHGNRSNAIVGGATIGKGSATKVIVLAFDNNDAVITPNGLELMSHRQIYAGYSHYWNKSLNSTFSAGWASLDNSSFQPGTAIHQGRSFHANLIWFPYASVSTGFEVMWGEREDKSGAEGDAVRLQYMFKYKFN